MKEVQEEQTSGDPPRGGRSKKKRAMPTARRFLSLESYRKLISAEQSGYASSLFFASLSLSFLCFHSPLLFLSHLFIHFPPHCHS